VVITSVTRDDLLDGGAQHFAACVRAVRRAAAASIELLVPDFRGAGSALQTVLDAGPDVLGHNVEVVPRLYPKLRARADYLRSLELLQRARRAQPGIYSKSGLMVGVGETEAEVIAVMRDLREVGCDLLTIGQYLQPSAEHFPLVEYVAPATFERYARLAKELGFLGVSCGPFVRSSYLARELLLAARDPRAEE
jgi:lipoic acid synthetase